MTTLPIGITRHTNFHGGANMKITFDHLANHKYLIPIVTQWHFNAFGIFGNNTSMERIGAKLSERLNTNKLDMCFLCFHNEKPIGVMSLTKQDIPVELQNHEKFTPLLSHLFVIESYRGQKIGNRLIEYAKQQTKNFGFKKMYLYTTDKTIHLWYEKLGWKIIQENVIEKLYIKIMCTDL